MRRDKYHQTVVNALEKSGWRVTRQQVALKTDYKTLFIDLEATRSDQNLVILIEIKGSEDESAQVHEFYNAVGQYLTYRSLLRSLGDPRQLYLAIPEEAYEGVFTQDIGRNVLGEFHIHLIVFNPETEEIIKWINR